MKIGIVGGGVMGRVLSFLATKRGHDVTLYHDGPASGEGTCSFVAGGMIAPVCEREISSENIFNLGMQSLDLWNNELSFAFSSSQTLVLAPREHQSDLDRFYLGLKRYGLENYCEKKDRGLLIKNEGHVDPKRFLLVTGKELKARWNTKIESFSRKKVDDETYDEVIDTRGLNSKELRLRGVRGEILTLRVPKLSLKNVVRILHPRVPLYLIPRGDEIFSLGATSFEDSNEGPIKIRSLLELLSYTYSLFPQLAEGEYLGSEVKARPALWDNEPLIDAPKENTPMKINGLYRHGYLLAPALGLKALEVLENL